MPLAWILVVLTSMTIAGAQLLIKRGSLLLHDAPAVYGLVAKALRTLFEPHIFVALALYVITFFVWARILASLELSKAYPVQISLATVLLSIGGFVVFNESFNTVKILGITLVLIGIALLTRG